MNLLPASAEICYRYLPKVEGFRILVCLFHRPVGYRTKLPKARSLEARCSDREPLYRPPPLATSPHIITPYP
jgi:hypothetical protein